MKLNSLSSRWRKYKDDGTWNVLGVCMVASLAHVANGNGNGWPSAAIPDIEDTSHKNPFYLNDFEKSWVSSINHLGAIGGGIVCGPFSDYLGRKPALLTVCLPYVISWLIIAGSVNVYMMYAGRFLLGFAQGVSAGICTVYLVEVAPLKIRGALAALGDVGYSLGKLYDYAFGAFLSWNWLAITNSALCTLMAVLVYLIPETPRWLVTTAKGKYGEWQKDEAAKILQSLRGGKNVDIGSEFKEIEASVNSNNKNSVSFKKFLKKNLFNLFISLLIITQFQLGGAIIVTQYTVSIFKAADVDMDSHLQTILVGIMDVIGALLCTVTIDYFGRRAMLTFSTFAMTVCMTALATYFYIYEEVDKEFAVNNLSWLPLVSLMLNELLLNTGVGALIWIMPSELFPTETRATALSISVAWSHACQFLASKYFGNMVKRIGTYGVFWLCAGIDLAGLIAFIFLVPETKDKSLEQLQSDFDQEFT
ncbi:Facilitated trehalose transporter Tret1 [Chamberlinius hualienensis]